MTVPGPETEETPPRYPEDAEEPLGLETYLRSDDHGEGLQDRTPFFEGRDDPLRGFEDAIANVSEGVQGGQTLVVQGAPGAGKSALLEECVDRLVRRSSAEGELWVPVRVKAADFEDPVDIHRRIRGMLSEYTGDKSLVERRKLASASYQLGATFMGSGGHISRGKTYETGSPPNFEFSNAALAQAYPEARILLLLDEAQNLTGEGKTSKVVPDLQQGGFGMPAVLACFGLSDTEETLMGLGLSRPGRERKFNLLPLSDDEVRTSAERAFRHFGEDTPVPDPWAIKTVQSSSGWPQHMKVAVLEAIREASGAKRENRAPVWPEQRISEAKRDYYGARLVAAGPEYGSLYAELARFGEVPLEKEQIQSLFGAYVRSQRAEDPDYESVGFDEFLRKTVHAGVLSNTSEGYIIPIPSFRDYIEDRFVPPKPSLRALYERGSSTLKSLFGFSRRPELPAPAPRLPEQPQEGPPKDPSGVEPKDGSDP